MEVPRTDWPSFFKLIHRLLEGRAVQIEEVDPVLGNQVLGDILPFEGLDYEKKGSDAGAVTLHVGLDETQLDHRVFRPSKVYVGINDVAALEWIAIEEADRGKTLIHFRDLPKLEGVHPGQ